MKLPADTIENEMQMKPLREFQHDIEMGAPGDLGWYF